MEPDFSCENADVFSMENKEGTPYLYFLTGEVEFYIFGKSHFWGSNDIGDSGDFCYMNKGRFEKIGHWYRQKNNDLVVSVEKIGFFIIRDMKLYPVSQKNNLEKLTKNLNSDNFWNHSSNDFKWN